MRTATIGLAFLLATGASACRSGAVVPETGAVLLRLTVTPGGPTPDELRVSVYDDSGTLWSDVRIPAEGALVPESADRLGTILIQPGASVGPLRLHVRGLAGGAGVLDGVLAIAPEARGRGIFDLALGPGAAVDDDGDGVPDQIDDCPGTANPSQGGCPSGVDAGDDGGPACDAAGGCDKPQGAACAGSTECASGFCADGVCCANACAGPCRSCNQPSADGVCVGYAQGMDPEVECSGTMTCNGAGACGPTPTASSKANGELCASATECSSGFCTDGVCCKTACTNPCQTCGTGTCKAVKKTEDVPECSAPMTCNGTGKCVAA